MTTKIKQLHKQEFNRLEGRRDSGVFSASRAYTDYSIKQGGMFMDTIDPAKAARVWQRVHADTPEPTREEGLTELIAREWEAASTYLQLSRRFQGRPNVLLRKLFEQEQAHVACLKGIYTLLTGKRPNVAGIQPVTDDAQKVLRRCYGRQMQCLARYEQRSGDPEYGHIFARLAQQEKEHCHILLELLGSLK